MSAIYFWKLKNGFKNILIPVDFTINTEVAIRKGLALCDGENATIHLLHVSAVKSINLFGIYEYFVNYSCRDNKFDMDAAKIKLERIGDYISSLRNDIEIFKWVMFNPSIESSIIQMACKLQPDLVIIGKNSTHSWLPFLNTVVSSRIAAKANTTVLTVKPGALNNAIRTIVVPISDIFPVNKLSVINSLRKRFPVEIKLVTFLTPQDDMKVIPASLLNAYRLLRTNTAISVSYEILYGRNKSREVLKYCNRIRADMIIVNPQTETKVGWLNKQMSDLLPANSKTQILAVQPVS